MIKKVVRSWKTTTCAVILIAPQALHLMFPKFISQDFANGISLIFGALGLTVAKDHDVTGDPPVEVKNT